MTNDDENRKIVKEQLDFYFRERLPVHLVLFKKIKTGENIFLNGILKEQFDENGYWLIEDKLGKIRVFVSEVMLIEDFTKVKR